MTIKAAEAFREFEIDGVPSSGRHVVKKSDCRALGLGYETALTAINESGSLAYETKELLDANTAADANLTAWVYGDSTAANNGVYQSDGSGGWTRIGDLPYSVISGEASGTVNDVTLTTAIPIPQAPYAALVSFTASGDNTDAMTINANGSGLVALKDSAGNALHAGDVSEDTRVWVVWSGSDFRLAFSRDYVALAAQMDVAAQAAGDARDLAEKWASNPEDVIVEGSEYSAYHWKQKAAGYAAAAAAAGTQIPDAADRTALKGISYTSTPVAFLRESLREGLFVWDSTVTIAIFSADTTEYTYVAPNAAANGAWRRVTGGSPAYVGASSVLSLKPSVAGAEALIPVSSLPDPSLASSSNARLLLAGQPPVDAYCDGAQWWDIGAAAAISPWWLPRGAVLHCDFENNSFYWAGAERTLGDLTSVAAGGYSLSYGFGFVDTAVIVLEYSFLNTVTPTGTVFSWTSGYPSGNRIEFIPSGGLTYGYGLQVYISPLSIGGGNYQGLASASKDGEGGARYRGGERHRHVIRFKNTELTKWLPDNGDYRQGTLGPGSLSTPTKLGFGCRAWASGDPDKPLTNGSLLRVTLYNTDIPTTHIQSIGRTGLYPAVHLLGDSFLNLYGILQKLEALIKTAGYIGMSQDGVGGTSLTEQAVRYATNNAKWRDATLVICDFGLDTTADQTLTALKSILANIRHDRWLYMEPAPNVATGFAARTTFDEKVYKIKDFCGGSVANGGRFVETLAPALLQGDGSTADNTKIAQLLWPVSLTNSDTDFHPNHTKGDGFVAGLIKDALATFGWGP